MTPSPGKRLTSSSLDSFAEPLLSDSSSLEFAPGSYSRRFSLPSNRLAEATCSHPSGRHTLLAPAYSQHQCRRHILCHLHRVVWVSSLRLVEGGVGERSLACPPCQHLLGLTSQIQFVLTIDAVQLELLRAGAHRAVRPGREGGIEARVLVDVLLELFETLLRVTVMAFLLLAAAARDPLKGQCTSCLLHKGKPTSLAV